MKRSGFKTKPRKPMKRTPLAKKSKLPKKSNRAKKMEMKRLLLAQYELPQLDCKRWGTNKGFTRTDLLRGMLWNVFSRFIRERDAGKCISCSAQKTYAELQAGHYAPVGGTSIVLWFDEKNVNGECEPCNAFDRFHLVPMRKNLIKKYGIDTVENIDKIHRSQQSHKWEEVEYVQRIKYYLDKLKK